MGNRFPKLDLIVVHGPNPKLFLRPHWGFTTWMRASITSFNLNFPLKKKSLAFMTLEVIKLHVHRSQQSNWNCSFQKWDWSRHWDISVKSDWYKPLGPYSMWYSYHITVSTQNINPPGMVPQIQLSSKNVWRPFINCSTYFVLLAFATD